MISEQHRGPDLRGEQAEPREELRVGCPVIGRSRVYTQRVTRRREQQAGKPDLFRGKRSGVQGCRKAEIRGGKGTLFLLLNAAVY